METPKPAPTPTPKEQSETRDSRQRAWWGSARVVLHLVLFDGKLQEESQEGRGIRTPPLLWSLAPCWGKIATVIAISCVFFFSFRCVNWIGSWRKTFWFPSNGECRLELQRQMEMISSKTTPKSLWCSRGVGCRIQQVPSSNGDERNIMKMLMGVCEGVRNHRGERHL